MILRDRDADSNGTLEERLWAVQDANYNVTALVDGSGNVVERYAYDAYGQVMVLDASYGSRSSSSYAWVYLWQGLRRDATTTLYHARYREVSATLGRPLQRDPIGFAAGDANVYRWVGNGPTGAVDPLGLEEERAFNAGMALIMRPDSRMTLNERYQQILEKFLANDYYLAAALLQHWFRDENTRGNFRLSPDTIYEKALKEECRDMVRSLIILEIEKYKNTNPDYQMLNGTWPISEISIASAKVRWMPTIFAHMPAFLSKFVKDWDGQIEINDQLFFAIGGGYMTIRATIDKASPLRKGAITSDGMQLLEAPWTVVVTIQDNYTFDSKQQSEHDNDYRALYMIQNDRDRCCGRPFKWSHQFTLKEFYLPIGGTPHVKTLTGR